jgi:hypothetical protein
MGGDGGDGLAATAWRRRRRRRRLGGVWNRGERERAVGLLLRALGLHWQQNGNVMYCTGQPLQRVRGEPMHDMTVSIDSYCELHND